MVAATKPKDERERLEQLGEHAILDSLPEQVYDDIAFLASKICDTPIALISFVDRDRQWFKSRIGVDYQQTPRDVAFCAHAILDPDALFTVEDSTVDLRFADNPLVEQGDFRFYAGVPLKVDGLDSGIGTLCVADREPRRLDDEQRDALRALARQVESHLQLRRAMLDLERHHERLESYQRQLEQANESLAAQRSVDSLTGVANRSEFDRRLTEEFDRSRRYGHPLSLLLADADHFKDYNDSHGHASGDEALRRLAEILDHSSRSSDVVARYGGEEFAVILPDTSLDGAVVIGERARRAIETASLEHPMTISMGAAEALDDDASPLDLITRADGALYRAKRQGRNRVEEAGVD